MEQEIKVEPSEELAYWVGAMQTDGSLWKYYRKEKHHFEFRLAMGVATKSLPMLQKVAELSAKIFKRYGKVYKRAKEDQWDYYIQVKQLLLVFKELYIKFGDPPKPPKWALEKPEFFGAYLAGVIDGDGCVYVKRKKYSQCVITVTSGYQQSALAVAIKQILKCSVYQAERYQKRFVKSFGRIVEGRWHTLEFYVSSKTTRFITDFIIPYLQLPYKKKRLEEFIDKRYSVILDN